MSEISNAVCPKCGSPASVITRGSYSVIDIIRASVLRIIVYGLLMLFMFIFGLAGGRFSLAIYIGVGVLVFFGLSRMIGKKSDRALSCAACGHVEPSGEAQ